MVLLFSPALVLMPICSNKLIASIHFQKRAIETFGFTVFAILLLCFVKTALADTVGANCAAPEFIAPRSALLHESRPLIEWEKVPGGNQYRVQVRSQVPEGRVLATIDTLVKESRFVPPQPLVESRAIVTVKVSAVCGSVESVASVKRFVLDVRRDCPEPSGARAIAKEGKLLLVWNPQPAVEGYRVVLRSALSGAELERRETSDAKASFDGGKYFNTLLMAAIESRCKGLGGAAVVLPINVSP